MRNPVIALIWESWRLSRRWYLWVLPLATILPMLIMRQAERLAARMPELELAQAYVLLSPGIFILTFILAGTATMLAVSVGNRSGFPFAFEFRLPARSSLLVAVPMLTLAMLCASLYLLPALVFRQMYGVPLPLLPVGALLASLVIILLACSWSTTSDAARSLAVIVGTVVAAQLFAAFDPLGQTSVSFSPGQPPRIGPEFVRQLLVLTPGEYSVLAVLCVLLIALATASIGKQRYGERPLWSLPGQRPAEAQGAGSSLSGLFERASNLFALPCPVSAPWRAELWLEMKRQVMPILVVASILSLAIPLLFALGMTPREELSFFDYLFPIAVFLSGIGLAVFNRRQASAGYMSAFEGARGMSTLGLASLQMLSVAAGTLVGVFIVCISLYFASAQLDTPGDLALRLRTFVSAPTEHGLVFLLTTTLTQLVHFFAAVLLLTCVHTWSVVWGRWIPYGAGVVAIYAAVLALNIRTGEANLDDIKRQMWGFALVVFTVTLFAFGRTLYLKVLSPRAGVAALAAWGVFVACSLYNMVHEDRVFTQLAAELQAFNAALLLMPLLLFVLLLWSYDRLRHR